MDFDIIIVGAGASGMMAGIAAASYFAENARTARIAIVERHPSTGRKLLATGNGLCNLSNSKAVPQNTDRYYYGENTGLIADIISRFTPASTIDFFEKIGVLCRTEEDGRVYPYNYQSSAVRNALAERLEELGVTILKSAEAKKISWEEGVFSLSCEPAARPAGRIADRAGAGGRQQDLYGARITSPTLLKSAILLLSAGGKASAALSSDGLGYSMCTAFGHTITPIYPAIVRLKAQNALGKGLDGVKAEACLSLMHITKESPDGKESREIIARESGEFLFTEDGISGPPVLQLAGHIKLGNELFSPYRSDQTTYSALQDPPEEVQDIYYVLADFFPGYTNEELADILMKITGSLAVRSIDKIFDGLLPFKLARAFSAKIFGMNNGRTIASIQSSEIAGSISILKNLPFNITGTAGWDNAQVTAGGIRLTEIDCATMESRLCPGLYLTGEILDATGYCGGFNLQFAWASGYVAGLSAGRQALLIQKKEVR